MIGIVTDSTCDIPEPLLKQYGIIVIPIIVAWGDQQYRDRVDLQPEEFYGRLRGNGQRPTSAVPSILEFEQAYRSAAAAGADELVVLTVSSAMSGVYQTAVKAAQLGTIPVTVIDSKGPTMSLGWQVLAAARARQDGANMQEIVQSVEKVRKQLTLLVYMDSLEYLERGGRIGRAVKWVGVALQVRPVVSVNHETGVVEPIALTRTRRGGVETMYNRFVASMGGRANLRVSVLHGNAQADAEALAERIREELHPSELQMNITGPVLGIHTGPGALALCGYGDGSG